MPSVALYLKYGLIVCSNIKKIFLDPDGDTDKPKPKPLLTFPENFIKILIHPQLLSCFANKQILPVSCTSLLEVNNKLLF